MLYLSVSSRLLLLWEKLLLCSCVKETHLRQEVRKYLIWTVQSFLLWVCLLNSYFDQQFLLALYSLLQKEVRTTVIHLTSKVSPPLGSLHLSTLCGGAELRPYVTEEGLQHEHHNCIFRSANLNHCSLHGLLKCIPVSHSNVFSHSYAVVFNHICTWNSPTVCYRCIFRHFFY